MKLLKLSEKHYIICDDSEIKIGDIVAEKLLTGKYELFTIHTLNDIDRQTQIKITHSTQPESLGVGWVQSVQPLLLSEVIELLGVVDVKKKAKEFYEFWYDKYGTSEIDTIERNAVSHGFWGAYNQFLEDNKEKKYTEEDMLRAYREGENVRYSRVGEAVLEKQFIQSIQPKTEWDVDVIDGKLKFI